MRISARDKYQAEYSHLQRKVDTGINLVLDSAEPRAPVSINRLVMLFIDRYVCCLLSTPNSPDSPNSPGNHDNLYNP